MKIICRRCGSSKKGQVTDDIYKNTHHLECDWCEQCEKPGDDFWEYFCYDVNNNLIEEKATQLSGLSDYEIELDMISDNIKQTDSSLQCINILRRYIDSKLPNTAKAGGQKTLKTVEQHELRLNEQEQACFISHVSNWLAFDKIKPEADKLFLITNGSFVEIAYYEDGEIMKPWRYDEYDMSTFNAQQNGLKWQYINLPACC